MWPSALFIASTLLVTANAAKQLPAKWKACQRNLPAEEYDKCVNSAVPTALSDVFVNGVPSLNIPPLEPFKIPQIDFDQGNGPVSLDIQLKDVEIGNVDSVEIKKVRLDDVEKYHFGLDMAWKKPLVVTGKYQMNGKVLVITLKGKGDCSLEFDHPTATLDFYGVPFTKGGQTYTNITQCNFNFNADKIHTNFDNLFDGNKELGIGMNRFLNENWDVILKELKPAISEAIGLSVKGVTGQVFSNIPYNQIFPPS